MAGPAGADVQRTIQDLHADASVEGVESDASVRLPETSPGAPLRQMGLPDPAPLSDRALVKYYGTSAWNAYVDQPAAFVIKVAQAHVFAAGSGTVAILDTGVDFRHLVIANSLVAGGAALLVQLGGNHFNVAQADQAISQAIPTGQGLGAGELDLFQACFYEIFHGGWR